MKRGEFVTFLGPSHLFRCFFCHKASVLLGIFCALSANELRTGAGAENVCFTDPVQAQPHRHGHPAQVHPDQGAANVDTGVGADLLHGNGVFELLPAGGGPAAARMGPGHILQVSGKAIPIGPYEPRTAGKAVSNAEQSLHALEKLGLDVSIEDTARKQK